MSVNERGWRSRGYLPHFEAPGAIQAVTFSLSDTMPKHVLQGWRDELTDGSEEERCRELRRRINLYEDAGYGCCVLRNPEAAEVVQSALLHFDEVRYRMIAWVVMPNHVHTLFQPMEPYGLAEIVGSWKKFTARWIRGRFDTCEPLWQREYFDRYIRSADHLARTVAYIETNPVKAGLVTRSEDYAWSSCIRRAALESGAP